jgi:hypothetical protein
MMGWMGRLAGRAAQLLSALLAAVACLGVEGGSESCSCGARERAGASAPAPDAAPSAPEATVPDFARGGWTRVPSRAGSYAVCWRPLAREARGAVESEEAGARDSVPRAVPRNEDFGLEVWVLRGDAPVPGVELAVNAWMPAHGHGMLRRARVVPRADGSFRVDGMLLHMRGLWELRFDVLEGTLSEAASCEIEL